MEVDDLDFMELLPVLGDELGDDDENFTLSQIADRIELDYIKSECMISNFADMTFDLGYQSESGETGPSHSNMEVTTIQDTCTLSENSLRFGNPVKDEDLDELISGTTPANTKKSTAWAVRVFNDWRISRNTALENIPNLDHFSVDDINRWLSRFIVEVRKRDGDFYPPKSLYLLTTGILRYMRENGNTLNFMNEKDDRFIRFRRSLDAQMKFLTSKEYSKKTGLDFSKLPKTFRLGLKKVHDEMKKLKRSHSVEVKSPPSTRDLQVSSIVNDISTGESDDSDEEESLAYDYPDLTKLASMPRPPPVSDTPRYQESLRVTKPVGKIQPISREENPTKKFSEMTTEEVVNLFKTTKLPSLASVCEKECLDGSFFSSLSETELKSAFKLSDLQIIKVNKIINEGWRPNVT